MGIKEEADAIATVEELRHALLLQAGVPASPDSLWRGRAEIGFTLRPQSERPETGGGQLSVRVPRHGNRWTWEIEYSSPDGVRVVLLPKASAPDLYLIHTAMKQVMRALETFLPTVYYSLAVYSLGAEEDAPVFPGEGEEEEEEELEDEGDDDDQ